MDIVGYIRRRGKPGPTEWHIRKCKEFGLEIEPGMTKWDVGDMITASPQYAEEQRKIAEQNEKEEREEYGDALVDEQKLWEKKLVADTCFLVVVRKGKTCIAEPVILESAYIDGERKPYVLIEGQRAKVIKGGVDYDASLDWDKPLSFRTTQVVFINPLQREIDEEEVDLYLDLKKQAAEMASSL